MNIRGFRILDRYIIRQFIGTYLFAIGLLIIVFVIFDAAEKLDDFIEMKAPLKAIAFNYYLNNIPVFITQFSGLLTFIAVIFFTSKMAYRTEIISILSSGVSFNRFLWPYFLSAFMITVMTLALNLVVIPSANKHVINFEMRYIKNMQAMRSQRHIYRQTEPDTYVYLRDFLSAVNTASYMTIERYEGNQMRDALDAASVNFNPATKRWTADEYIIRTFDGDEESYARLSMLDTVLNLETSELGRVEDFVKTMDIFELGRFIEQQRAKGSDMIDIFEVERQTRYAYPMGTFILTFIGVSLSSRKVRGGTGLHIGIGIALCFSYILVSKFTEEYAKNGVIATVIAMWIPNLLYTAISLYLYKSAPK
jgi:lipopolysaccharide export system permease protein